LLGKSYSDLSLSLDHTVIGMHILAILQLNDASCCQILPVCKTSKWEYHVDVPCTFAVPVRLFAYGKYLFKYGRLTLIFFVGVRCCAIHESCSSAVSIATECGLDNQGVGV
jgi:hypothetical protein